MKVDWPTIRRQHARNIGLLALTVLALYWRVFFLGETIIDTRTLDNQLPWGASAIEEVNHPYNRRDPTDMYLTREYFIVQAYRDGELPMWNPYTMAGHPIYADGVTRIFSPFLLIYTFLDMPLGYSVARLTELLLGAIFMYLFLIAIGVSPRGALLGALVFELSAHSLFHLTGLGWWGGLLWLPLIFLFIDRAVTRNDFKAAILAGVVVALQLFCGYLPNQIYYIAAIALYYLFFGLRVKQTMTTARSLMMLVVTLGVGLALAATQWVPVLELLGFSNRRIVPSEAGYVYLPPWYIATLVFPDLFGTAYDAKLVTLFTALNVSHDHSLYLGIAALLPLGFLFASFVRKLRKRRAGKQESDEKPPEKSLCQVLREKRITFFVLLTFLALLVMMAAPIYVYLTQFFPVVRSIRVIVRAGVVFIFAISVLAGFGTDALLQAGKNELLRFRHAAKRFLLVAFALAAAGVLATYAGRFFGLIGEGDFDYVAGSGRLAYLQSVATAMAQQFAPPKTSVLLPLAFLLVGYGLLKLWQEGRLTERAFYWALVVFLIADLSLNSLQYDGTHDRARVFPRTQITETLKSLPPGRLLVAPSSIESNRRARDNSQEEKIIAPPNTLLAYQVPTVTGKDQLFPKAYREFCSLIEPQPHLSHVVFDQTSSRFFDLLSVKYVLTHESAPAPSASHLVLKADGLALYENQNALPRAFFAQKALAPGVTQAEAMERLREVDFDAQTTAIIDGAKFNAVTTAGGTATIIEDRRNRVVIETTNENEGVLVLSDNWYPGWQATIDGVPTELLRANYTLRAVRVPAGRHMISFTFVPPSFWAAVYLSSASAILVLVSLILLRTRRREIR